MRKVICRININTKAKAKNSFWGINFTLIFVSTVVFLCSVVCFARGADFY